MPEQKPSIGRIVHYVDAVDMHMAAIIVDVNVHAWAGVNLVVFDHGGNTFPRTGVPFSAEPRESTWHWPERVE
jgi:hypothetical protein